MKFRYARYGPILRPVIPIKIKFNNKEVGYHVLVDSGADLCLFDEEIGQALDIDIRSGEAHEVFGVGGKSSIYYLHDVKIEIGGWEHKIKTGFMQHVAGQILPYGIVGQKGFFENYIVKFDLRKEEIDLIPREK